MSLCMHDRIQCGRAAEENRNCQGRVIPWEWFASVLTALVSITLEDVLHLHA